jgi:hypothetical protein
VGPKGFEPLLAGLKVRCAAVTPRPRMRVGRMRFNRVRFIVVLLLAFLRCGSPESRTQRDPVISRVWATGPRLPFANVVVVSIRGWIRVARPEERRAWRTARHALVLRDVPPSTNVSLHRVGTAGLEPAILCSQNTRVRRYPTSRRRFPSLGWQFNCRPNVFNNAPNVCQNGRI